MPFTVPPNQIRAFIFDLDGVLTETEKQHTRAWKRMFDEYLKNKSKKDGTKFKPFEDSDYRDYVDGKPRYDGVRDFLKSRNISIPEGKENNHPDRETIHGLGDRKDNYFHEILEKEGAKVYQSSIDFIRSVRKQGIKTAVISSSKNTARILRITHIEDLFDAKVDGNDLDALNIPGKPDPSIFFEAAKRLRVKPEQAAIVEDSLAGVEAGRRGKFGLVVGMAHEGDEDQLRQHGANVAVDDLLKLDQDNIANTKSDRADPTTLPSALDDKILNKVLKSKKELVVFLDYDGTLTEIVDDPSKAFLSEETRRVLEQLSSITIIAILSGRDVNEVRKLVDIGGITYAGSHGFDIITANGKRRDNPKWLPFLPIIEQAERDFRAAMKEIACVRIERKRFAISVHYRKVKEPQVKEVRKRFSKVASAYPKLRKTGGKKVFEVLPNVKWNKGKALRFLLKNVFREKGKVLPVFIGDDLTDEDGFRAVNKQGIGILVVDRENMKRRTLARYTLRNPTEVRLFLQKLAQAH